MVTEPKQLREELGIKREQKSGWKLEEHLEMRVWLFQMFEC